MIPYNTIPQTNVATFYNSFNIKDEFLVELEKLIEEDFDQDALDLFLEEYLIPASEAYADTMIQYLYEINQGPFRESDLDKTVRNVSLLSLALSAFLISSVKKYADSGYFDKIFDKNNINDRILKKNIINEVLSEFDNLFNSTIGQTQNFILSSIRTLQREMLSENLLLKNAKLTGEALESEVQRFRESLLIKYPLIYKAMNQGNIMTVTRFSEGVEKTRHYKIGYYVDLIVRTSLLNADRTAVNISALVNDEPVVEYYLADPRQVKKDREICQEILGNKINGLSILALNEEAAEKLNIMTVDEAKSTPDYAMGPLCRHSIRRVSKDYLESIKKLLEG